MSLLQGIKAKILAVVIALACIAGGVYLTFFHSRGFVGTAARIVSVRESFDSDGDWIYYPTVEYTVDGKTYRGELDVGSSSYREGDTIRVLYDPENPTVVHGASPLSILLIIFGAAMLVLLAVSTILARRGIAPTGQRADIPESHEEQV